MVSPRDVDGVDKNEISSGAGGGMKSSQVKAKLFKLEAHASHLLDAFLVLRERYAMLHPMLFGVGVPERWGSGKRARGYLILRHTLFLACCQDIAKVVMDDDKRTPSIKGLIGELDCHLVRAALRKRYAEVSPTLMDGEPDQELAGLLRAMDEREALERGVMFDRLYSDLVAAWADLSTSEAVKGYVTIRDKASAHAEVVMHDGVYSFFDVSTAGITWGDLRRTIASVQGVVELLGRVIRDAGFAWDMLDDQLARAADGFWDVRSER